MFVIEFFWVFLPPTFRHPAALVEELPDDYSIVAQHVLGHPNPVDLDVLSEIFPPFDSVLVDRSIVGDDDGDHHRLGHFLFSGLTCRPLAVFLVLLLEGMS